MGTLGTLERDGLIVGGFPTVSQGITLTGPAEFKRGDVVGVNGDGVVVMVDSSATDGSQSVIGIICDNVTIADGETAESTIYIKGEFSRRFMQFGGSDTADTHLRQMAKDGMIIRSTRV